MYAGLGVFPDCAFAAGEKEREVARLFAPYDKYTVKEGTTVNACLFVLGYGTLEEFQIAGNLSPDGICGERTWKVLCAKLKEKGITVAINLPPRFSFYLKPQGEYYNLTGKSNLNNNVSLNGKVRILTRYCSISPDGKMGRMVLRKDIFIPQKTLGKSNETIILPNAIKLLKEEHQIEVNCVIMYKNIISVQ
jgi:hypothetical protein